MKKLLSIVLPTLALGILASQSALAAEHPGKALHEQADCMQCHAAKPYDAKKSDTYPKLVARVQVCSDNFNTGFFEDEVEQLADYLNDEYYQHPKE